MFLLNAGTYLPWKHLIFPPGEGFLRDFAPLEKAVLKARSQIGADAADEILKDTKKTADSGTGKERQL